jgi:adenylate kinase
MTRPSLNLFIIGPSGSGKSTQAKLIADKYGLIHLSMGQLLRDEMAAKSNYGLEAKKYIDQGKWVPDELVYQVLTSKLALINNSNYIIDGFPRILKQALLIEEYLSLKNQSLSLLILLTVSYQEITLRRQNKGQSFQKSTRTDNTPKAIASRQKSYDDTIDPIKYHYQTLKKLFEVDGNRPVEPIFEDIVNKIDSLIKN